MSFVDKTLLKGLQRVAAQKLHNTRGVPKNLKDKLELISIAFGRDEVLADFANWCDENAPKNPQYPVSEYIRVIDGRLGNTPKIDVHDERIANLQAFTYDLAGVLPQPNAIREVLTLHEIDEIKKALQEFILTLEDREIKSGVRTFYDGGASAVIYSRKKRGLVESSSIQIGENTK